jgi:hypothetical protein
VLSRRGEDRAMIYKSSIIRPLWSSSWPVHVSLDRETSNISHCTVGSQKSN